MSLGPWDAPKECSDPDYAWLQNSEGQSACSALTWEFEQPCFESLGNTRPLTLSACACSTVPYSILFACGLCSDTKDLQLTFGEYAVISDCESAAPIGQYSGPTFGVIIPSWALQQLTGNGTFDVTKAAEVAGDSSFGGGVPSASDTGFPEHTPTPTPTTPSEPFQPTEFPTQNSEDSESPTSTFFIGETAPGTASASQPISASNGFVGGPLSVGGGVGSSSLPTNGPGSIASVGPESAVATSRLLESFTVVSSETYWQTRTQTEILPSPSASSSKPKRHVAPIAAGVSAAVVALMAIIIAAGVFYGGRRRRRHRGATTVSPLCGSLNTSQISTEAVALAPSALSAVSRPPSVVLHLQSTEGHLVDSSLSDTRMRLDGPDNPSTYPPAHSELALSKTWSDSSLPPYSP